VLPSFACWCEQDQVATVLETCVMKVLPSRPECFQSLATSEMCVYPARRQSRTHRCARALLDLASGCGQNALHGPCAVVVVTQCCPVSHKKGPSNAGRGHGAPLRVPRGPFSAHEAPGQRHGGRRPIPHDRLPVRLRAGICANAGIDLLQRLQFHVDWGREFEARPCVWYLAKHQLQWVLNAPQHGPARHCGLSTTE